MYSNFMIFWINTIVSTEKFGFQNSHLRNHVLIIITETIREALDRHEYSCGVFQDFQEETGTVSPQILISKTNY